MCRLTRWLVDTEETEDGLAFFVKDTHNMRAQALKELQRVTTGKIVFTARIANHQYAYPLEAIEAAIEPGWKLAENIEAGEPEYRVFVLERE
jgi:hypothetical protein